MECIGIYWNATPGWCENGETKAHDVDEICLKHMAHLWHQQQEHKLAGIPWDRATRLYFSLHLYRIQDPRNDWVFGPPDVGHFHRPKKSPHAASSGLPGQRVRLTFFFWGIPCGQRTDRLN